MKRNFLSKAIIAISIMFFSLPAVSENLRVPVAPESTGAAMNITGTTTGDHNGLDVNLTGGTITLTTPAYQITAWEFHLCSLTGSAATACNCTNTSTTWIVFNGSTAATLWINPGGTAAVNNGIPLTKSGVAFDNSFGLGAMSVKNFSIYNDSSATTAILFCGR